MLDTQLCSRLEPPYLCYGFLIYFLLFHVHCFFWLQCMMDVYEKNVSLGKQLQFVNLKMLVLTHLSYSPHPTPSLERLGRCGRGRAHHTSAHSRRNAEPEHSPGPPLDFRSFCSNQRSSPWNAEPSLLGYNVVGRDANLNS